MVNTCNLQQETIDTFCIVRHIQPTSTCSDSLRNYCIMYMFSMLCLEYRVSWVRVPPEAAHFFKEK